MDYQKILSCLLWVPHDIFESRLEFESLVASKMIGSSLDIHHVNEQLLNDDHINFDRYFNFIWSTEETLDKAIEASEKFKFKPIHISCRKHSDFIYIDDINESIIARELDNLRNLIIKECSDEEFSNQLRNQKAHKTTEIPFPFPPLAHNCAVPSVRALNSCGYKIGEVESLVPSISIEQHSEGIIKLASLIDGIRASYNFPKSAIKNDGIVFCPSFYTHLYKPTSKMWNDLYRTLPKVERNFIKYALVRNKGYSNFELKVDGEDGFNPYENQIVKQLLSDRQIELRLFTDIVSIVCANQFCPAIRLPNGVMLHHDRLKNIASLITSPSLSKSKNIKKLNNKLKSYNEAIRKDVGDTLLKAAFHGRKKILAICDFPIEWINLDSIPLMFTHEISRVFPTPGNMLGPAALRSKKFVVPYVAFTDILIIRSFDAKDPIRNHLTESIDTFSKSGDLDNIRIEIVDVSSVLELVDALNAFKGLIVIFDCHGGHGGEEDNAWLYIGNEKLNVWNLANKCRIPPIVILSACSTHPVDGSHASVANGLFRCGALSVLGTYAPINAIHAGQFVGRLLLRISMYVPIIIEKRPISWREILTGLLRMSYVTDVLIRMKEDHKIDNFEQYSNIHEAANTHINSGVENWQGKFFSSIEEFTDLGESEIKEFITEDCQFVETMLYSQLGRPENILICKTPNAVDT